MTPVGSIPMLVESVAIGMFAYEALTLVVPDDGGHWIVVQVPAAPNAERSRDGAVGRGGKPERKRTLREGFAMNADTVFSGSLPETYDSHLGPMFFAPYADDISERAAELAALRVLELASGTGIATAALAARLPKAEIAATDLNEAMVSVAGSKRDLPAVRWSVADAMNLPFEGDGFDLVVCQFGVMFFSDRPRAFRETRRVLGPSGTFLFSVWDSLEHNDVARIAAATVAAAFPDDPPRFVERTPYGHSDPGPILRDLLAAGFNDVTYDIVTKRSRAACARDAAVGICQGSPLRNEIIARDPSRLSEVLDEVTEALGTALGREPMEGTMRAYVYRAA